ncbi:hypothetical protein QE152_g31202 [Popillia japonica]|uniref:Uncharacterized protein n=1 Tax=Popillia japonica TaxID=7064 RepID=A0AAW1JCF7_POPJA
MRHQVHGDTIGPVTFNLCSIFVGVGRMFYITDTDNENNLRSSYIRFLPSPTGIRPAAVQNASVVLY